MAKKIRYRTYIGKDFGTVATRNLKTGKLTGRKAVKGFGDKTAVRRVSSPKEWRGTIRGRTPPIKVRGSKRARGTLRRTL